MPRIPMVEPDNEPAELKPVFDQLRRTRGRVPGMYRTLAHHPAILAAHRGYFNAALDEGHLTRAFKERIVFKVVRECGSAYSTSTHRAYALKLGATEKELEAIERSDYPALEPRLAAAVEFAAAMVRERGKVPDELVERMKSHYSTPELIEIAALVGVVELGCVLGAVFGLEAE
jgi:alkylhydroperoxidase family enzyme